MNRVDPVPALTRRSRWLLGVVHLPLLLSPVLLAFSGDPPTTLAPLPAWLAAVSFALVVCALQLRHSLAAARGTWPAGWPWTLLALVVATYLPRLWFPESWYVAQWAVIASVLMLLPVRVGAGVAGVVVVGSVVHETAGVIPRYGLDAWGATTFVLYLVLIYTFGSLALVAAARLVRVIEELAAARAELAELAVGRERLRVSRDLHDLLGQSLSAVSLKGDLALRLWPSDRAAALAEVASLTGVARGALRDVRAVTFDRHRVSPRAELDGAQALLAAAGIDTRIDLTLPATDPAVSDALGWVLREAVTNILRHSDATEVVIVGGARGDRVGMEISNDGVRCPAGPGSGLAGLAERVEPLGGTLDAGPDEGRFRLRVELPREVQ